MQKILIVAHPDDEVLWFNPIDFDKIFIFFCNRQDRPEMKEARVRVLAEHPLKKKIEWIGLEEPGTWKDNSRKNELAATFDQIKVVLRQIKHSYPVSEIFTHNSVGEYGHYDHVLLHYATQEIFSDSVAIWCPTKYLKTRVVKKTQEVAIDRELFKKIRDVYVKQGAWTWNNHYLPKPKESYYLANGEVKVMGTTSDIVDLILRRKPRKPILVKIKNFLSGLVSKGRLE